MLESVRVTIVAVGEKSITYFECVFVALGTKFVKRMLNIILASVAC